MVGVLLSVRAGPDVRPPIWLPVGKHVVGSGRTATMQLEDPFLEPHHFEIVVDGKSSWQVRELTGSVRTVTVEGSGDGAAAVDRCEFIAGASRIVLVRSEHIRWPTKPRIDRPDRRIAVVRPLRTVPADPVCELAELQSIRQERDGVQSDDQVGGAGPGLIGLLGPLMGLVVAISMAVVMRQLLYLVFALSAAVVSGATWLVALRRKRRATQADRAERQAVDDRYYMAQTKARSAVGAAHDRAVPSVDLQLGLLDHRDLWARRQEHGDVMRVVIGEGVHRYGSGEELIELAEVCVPVDLRQHRAIALTGPFAEVVRNSILMQLALQSGPADWLLMVDEQVEQSDRWMDLLPQRADVGEVAEDGSDGRHLVAITRGVEQLVTPSTRLRRLLGVHPSMTVITMIDVVNNDLTSDGVTVPAVCDGVFHTGLSALGRWHTVMQTSQPIESGTGVAAVSLRLAGVSASTARDISLVLRHYVDPEFESDTALPIRVDLAELVPVTAEAVADGWQRSSVVSATMFPAVIGIAESQQHPGQVMPHAIDLVIDGPHALVAGTTGSGKSELLRTLVLSMAIVNRPDEVNFVLVDYKGGATFDACERLVHTVGVVTDLDAGLAERALISLEAELRRRERLLRDHSVGDLVAYRKRRALEPQLEALPRLVVVIDEFAALVKEVPGFIGSLVGVAQRGRSLGIHLILATQRPAGVLDDAIRANTDLRIALRLNDSSDANDVAGSMLPTTFPRTCPGRALIRGGPGDQVIVQSAISAHVIEEVVDAVGVAAVRLGFTPPRRPWLPPLSSLSRDDFEVLRQGDPSGDHPDLIVGVVDDPGRQSQGPLRWQRHGNLVLIGSRSSGASSALSIVVRAERRAGTPVSMIDASGTGLVPDPGVVLSADTDRLLRLLRLLSSEIDDRRVTGVAGDRIDRVLAIDGLASLRRGLEDMPAGRDLLDRVMADGPAVGLGVVASLEADGGRSASVLGRFSQRWVFAIDDPAEASLYGVPAARLPSARWADVCECVIAGSCLSARLFEIPTDDQLTDLTTVGVLAASIRFDDVVAIATRSPLGSAGRLVIGLDHLDLLPSGPRLELAVDLDQRRDQHLLVLGPPRSGRSTALATIAAALVAERQGDQRDDQLVIRTLHSVDDLPDDEWKVKPTHPESLAYTVWLIDDLEAVEDRDQRLESWVERHTPGRVIIAAGRPDVLRDRYGHWSAALRRSRCGLIMSATPDRDADLLGIAPPRRCPLPARPGLAWVIEPDGSEPHLIQIATVHRQR